MAELARPDRFAGGRLMWVAAALGGLGLVVTLLGFALAPQRTLYAYLTAFTFAVSMSLGALILIMIGHLTGARWILVLRQLASAVAAALPVLALLSVPIWIGAAELYPWVEPAAADLSEHERELVAEKQAYLNLPAFVIRGIVYLALWVGVWFLLSRWATWRPGARPGQRHRLRVLSAAALPFVGLTLTFASFDWIMSLQPTWYSSIFGVYYFAGGFLGALALLAVIAVVAERRGYLTGFVTGWHYHGLGRLILAFVAFWAYAGFFQLFLIYIANLPTEVPFYTQRLQGGWDVLFWALVLGHFVLPFFVLLSRPIKSRRIPMLVIGAWLVAMHYLDVYWLVLPAESDTVAPHWADAAALVGVVGLCVAFGAWTRRGDALVPIDDPDLERAVAYRSG